MTENIDLALDLNHLADEVEEFELPEGEEEVPQSDLALESVSLQGVGHAEMESDLGK